MTQTLPTRTPSFALHSIIGLALILLMLLGRIPSDKAWALVIANSAHGPVSAILAVLAMSVSRARRRAATTWSVALRSVIGVITIGILVELVQGMIGHDAEIRDVVTDAMGALAGAGLYACILLRDSSQRRASRIALGVAMMFSLILAAPVLTMLAAYAALDLRWPTLVDADLPLGMYFMGAHWITPRVESLPDAWRTITGKQHGYHVRLGHQEHPEQRWGLSLQEFRADWRASHWLSVALVNPTDHVLRLNIRVFDRQDGLSNRIGWRAPITLPARSNRTLRFDIETMHESHVTSVIDVGHVRGVVIEAEPDNTAQEFYLLNLSLN